MSILDDLATLPVNAEFELPTNSTDYQDPTPPAPIPEGIYRLKVTEMELDKRQDGSLNLTDGQWPVVNLKRIEVVEPAEHAGKVAATFQRCYTKPFIRAGVQGPSGFSDLIRAYDQTIGVSNVKDGIEALQRLVDEGATFRGRIVWSAYDTDQADAEYAAIGGKSMASKEQHKAVRKAATVSGMKRFPKLPDGSYSPVVTGPSGATLTARAELKAVIPSGQDAKIG